MKEHQRLRGRACACACVCQTLIATKGNFTFCRTIFILFKEENVKKKIQSQGFAEEMELEEITDGMISNVLNGLCLNKVNLLFFWKQKVPLVIQSSLLS